MKYPAVLFTYLVLLSCSEKKEALNKFSDPEILRIADLQDRRETDSLLIYFSNNNKKYRKEAVLAFASIQDTLAVDHLSKILNNDSDSEVRASAAFSLGQIDTKKSSFALMDAYVSEKNELVSVEIIQALGKTSPNAESSIRLVKPKNENIETAFAWSYYRLGLKGINEPEIVTAAYKLLASKNESTRLASAYFFSRVTVKDFTDTDGNLRRAASDKNVFVRIAATQGLRNVKTDSSRLVLLQNMKDVDERVRVSAVRALRTFTFSEVADALFNALTDSSLQVRVAAAEILPSIASKEYSLKVEEAASHAKDWRVQASLYETAISLNPKKSTFESIQQKYETATNAYQKAALLNVLGKSAANYPYVGNELLLSKDPIILSSAALALTACNSAIDFSEKEKTGFLKFYQQAIDKGDAAVTGIIAQLLGDSSKNYKSIVKDIGFLKNAHSKLSLPKDNEAIQPIEAAIAYFENRKPIEVKNEYNHPIDWALVKTISTNQKAVVKTTKGDIVLSLFVNEAPGSVANFVMLTQQHYFDNKFFHRVVPNFVIQAGCNRGDGWGSEDYSIRSEFTKRVYKEGSVGMASAGKDTEGTQWFITHSPTPHLDGRYTIFAEVVTGMEVVNAIGVGDQILTVELK